MLTKPICPRSVSRRSVSTISFITREENLEAYLELMKMLLAKVLVGDNAAVYDDHMKAKYERGDIEMSWQALVVSAVEAQRLQGLGEMKLVLDLAKCRL